MVNRLKLDKVMIQEIGRSPAMRAEQGEGWLSQYGGPAHASVMASLPSTDKHVYYAVAVDGIGNVSEIAQATGLSEAQVNASLSRLNKQGLTSITAEPLEL